MTKEEKIKELEDKVRVINLRVYKKEMENKYFLVHKGAINNGADKEINILDAKSLTREKLKEYADRGRSKVLR